MLIHFKRGLFISNNQNGWACLPWDNPNLSEDCLDNVESEQWCHLPLFVLTDYGIVWNTYLYHSSNDYIQLISTLWNLSSKCYKPNTVWGVEKNRLTFIEHLLYTTQFYRSSKLCTEELCEPPKMTQCSLSVPSTIWWYQIAFFSLVPLLTHGHQSWYQWMAI